MRERILTPKQAETLFSCIENLWHQLRQDYEDYFVEERVGAYSAIDDFALRMFKSIAIRTQSWDEESCDKIRKRYGIPRKE